MLIIWPVSKHSVMGAKGPQRRDVATPDNSSQGKKKPNNHSVLFRLKGGKEAVAEARGRVAEENRTSQGVSLLDKQGLGFRGHQPLLREPFAFKSGGWHPWCPPSSCQECLCSLAVSGIDHGIHRGNFLLHMGTHDLT